MEIRYKNGLSRSMMGRYGLDFSGSGWGHVLCSYKGGNKLSGSIKCGVFLD
jgi:hypothetical protein